MHVIFLDMIVFFSQVNISVAFSYHKLQNSLMIIMISINLIFFSPKQFMKVYTVTIGIYLELHLNRINIYQVSEIHPSLFTQKNIFSTAAFKCKQMKKFHTFLLFVLFCFVF